MLSLFKKRGQKIGAPPGTPIHVGAKKIEKVEISVIDYDEERIDKKLIEGPVECEPYRDTKTVSWINVNGLHDVELIEALGRAFKLHPLVLEDIVNTTQRPKMEEYDDYIYIVVKMLTYNHDRSGIDSEQVSIILGPRFVLTFQEREGDVFNDIRERIANNKGRIRKMGADYLAYALIDAIVDHYFIILERIGEDVENLEEALIENPEPEVSGKIHRLKRMAILLRKSIWPLRELVSGLERSESNLITKGINVFLRDVYDHTIQIIDTVETYRDMLAGMRDTYLSSLSNRMNQVMKVLTIIATIFIPLTFIAGIYGMNFKHMPELQWRFGYAMVWGIILIIATIMLLLFKKKKWL